MEKYVSSATRTQLRLYQARNIHITSEIEYSWLCVGACDQNLTTNSRLKSMLSQFGHLRLSGQLGVVAVRP